jgi:hypothetical protein
MMGPEKRRKVKNRLSASIITKSDQHGETTRTRTVLQPMAIGDTFEH